VLAETQREEEGDEEQKPIETPQTSNSATDRKKAGKKKGEDPPLHHAYEFQHWCVLT